MSEKFILKAEKRKIEGKKVKQLRRRGLLPANLFGKGVKSLSLELDLKEFLRIFQKAGETHLIDLALGSDSHSVLVHHLQLDPVSQFPLHVDFQQVSLKDKISATVPITLVGESPAEKEGIGILVQQLSEIEVEALPTDLPDHLEADVSGLSQVNASLFVKDLKTDTLKVTIPSGDLEKIVAKVEPPAKEEVATPAATSTEPTPAESEAAASTDAEPAPAKEEAK